MATEKHEKSSPLPAILILASVVGVGGFMAFTMFNSKNEALTLETQSIERQRTAKDLKLQQQGELVAPAAWADKAKGTATIPVDRAMTMVVKTLQQDPNAATPAPPPPPPAADPDAGAEAAVTDEAGAASSDAGAAEAEGGAPKPPKPPVPKPPPVAPPVE